jgi:muramoyltetrapeptide carboxypeptidase
VLIKPRALRGKDRVAIVAPASRPAKPSMIARAKRIVQDMGFEPVLGRHLLSTHGYMAGTDEERLSDFCHALTDPSIHAVWAITGGFGSIHLLDNLPYESFKENPKIVLGGDDVSHILLALYKKSGVVTLSAPNLDRIDSKEIFERVKKALTSTDHPHELVHHDKMLDDFCFSPVEGFGKGKVIAANLTALVSLFGTPYEPDIEGAVLVLEDRSERNDILDRWLTTIYISGKLSHVAAVAFGHFEDCDSRGAFNMLSFEELAADRLSSMRIPCSFDLPFGQSAETFVVPIGVTGVLDTAKGKLTFSESALSKD